MGTRLGTAEWADPGLVEEKYRYRDGDVWLGRSASEKQIPLGYRDDRHVCLVSGSRGGKGTSSIINNLCVWPGSVVVVDPKGENATVTVPRRGKGSAQCEGLGQAVHVLDPFKSAQVDDSYRSRFNPLDALNPESEETIDEAGRIADAIVVIHEQGNDPFWDESARSLVKGLLLHILTAEEYEGRRNLITLRKLITRGDWEAVEALRQSGEQDIPPGHGLLWTRLQMNPAFEGLVAGIGDTFTNMLLNSPKQFESVLQVANRNTEFIDSPAMQRCLEASDFEISGLKTKREGMSLYLCLPQRYMSTHYRWLRMMIALTVTEMEIVRGRPATGFPVLMLLDEFAGLKRMEVIEHAVAQIAGYGVKLFFVLQSLEQLKAAYKENWETFLSNSGLKIFFSLDDHFSREYVSKLVGETEIIREVRSASDSLSESESVSRSTGTSVSKSSSVSEGTNRSASDSESRGINSSTSRSKGRSFNTSWAAAGIFGLSQKNRQYSRGTNRSTSNTEGTSRGWSHSDTEGVSHGTSDTYGSSESETYSTTHGTSRSRTTGASETVHRRPLISPDEIGHLFARIDDLEDGAYPGLALIVISGERAIALHRVNYFEDFQFARRFEPHPDFPAALCWKDLSVSVLGMAPYIGYLKSCGVAKPAIDGWLAKPGQIVSGGDPVVAFQIQGTLVNVKSPYTGMITKIPEPDKEGAFRWLFSLRYGQTQEPETYPFEDVAAFVRNFTAGIRAKMTKAKTSAWIMFALAVFLVIGLVAKWNLGVLAVTGMFAFAGFLKAAEAVRCKQILRACPQALLEGRADGSAWKIEEAPHPVVEVTQPALPTAKSLPAESPAAISPAAQENEGTASVPAESQPEFREDGETVSQPPAAVPAEVVAPEAPTIIPAPSETKRPNPQANAVSSRAQTEGELSPVPEVLAKVSPELKAAPHAGEWKWWVAGLVTLAAVVVLVVVVPLISVNKRNGEGGTNRNATTAHPGSRKVPLPPVSSHAREGAGPGNSPGVPLQLTLGYTLNTAVVNSLAFSSDGHLLATAGLNKVRLWDMASGREIATLAGGNNWHSVSFSADGHLLASGGVDGIKLWDVTDATAQTADLKYFNLPGHKDRPYERIIGSLALSPDGRLLASAECARTVKVEEVSSGRELFNIPGLQHENCSVAISPNGQMLAYTGAEGAIGLSDLRTGKEIRTLTERRGMWMSLAFSPDGRLLASSGERTIVLWNMSTGSVAHILKGHSGWVNSVAFSPDGLLLASGSDDNTTKIWQVTSGKEIGTTLTRNNGDVVPVAFSPNGRFLAVAIVGVGDNSRVKVWRFPAK